MQSVVGIFPSLASAEQAVEGLLGSGMTQQSIIFLSGEVPDRGGTRSAEQELEAIPTTDAEPDGMGKAMGAVVGGALGASAGLAGGAAVASLLVLGVGTVFAIGLGAPRRWDSAVPLRERRQGMSPSTRSMWEFRKTMCSSITTCCGRAAPSSLRMWMPRNKPPRHGPCSSSRVAKMWTEPARSWEKRHKQASRFNFRPESRIAFRSAGLRSVVLAAPAENLQTTC
jgi:hypothetical protein